MEEEQQRKVK
jgi:hypothetical protein